MSQKLIDKDEEKSFEELYRKYENRIKYFVFNIVKDYEVAEDITQESFLYLLKKPLKENCSFKYYIYLIAKSRAYSYISGEKRKNEISEKYLFKNSIKEQNDVSETIIDKEEIQKIYDAINHLDEKYRIVMYLAKIEDFSYREISELLRRICCKCKSSCT